MILQKNSHNEEMAKHLAENTKQLVNELDEKEEYIN